MIPLIRALLATSTCALLSFPDILLADTIFVRDADTIIISDGSSWNSAFRDLQSALDIAEPGDEIWVAKGRYIPAPALLSPAARSDTFTLPDDVAIYGGFTGSEANLNDRRPESHLTVLSGDLDNNDLIDESGITRDPGSIRGQNAYSVVTAPPGNDPTTILDGFTITGGAATATSGGTGSRNRSGGGLFVTSAAPTLRNLVLIGNHANQRGGGAYLFNSDAIIDGCTFHHNQADQDGGGLCIETIGSPVITSSTFQANVALDDGGAIAVGGADTGASFGSVLVTGNVAADRGGGFYLYSLATCLITNCSVTANDVEGGTGRGAVDVSGATLTARNSIFWNNANAEVSTGQTLDRCIVDGGYTGATNLITTTPLFFSSSSLAGAPSTFGDYRLRDTSPARDSGDDAHISAASFPGGLPRDVAGLSRRFLTVDRGAHESRRTSTHIPIFVSADITSHGNGAGENPYIIAADVDNAGAAYDRDAIQVEAEVGFFNSSNETGTYLVSFRLEDDRGNPVILKSGGTAAASPAQAIALNGSSTTRTFSAELRPDTLLDPQIDYKVRAILQERYTITIGTSSFFFVRGPHRSRHRCHPFHPFPQP